MAKLIISGGTGWLGSAIARHYAGTNHKIVVLTRQLKSDHDDVRYVYWNGHSLGEWYKELDGADAVINLAGASINCRFTSRNKDNILRSRTETTAVIGEAIQRVVVPPKLWINASGISIYEPSDTIRNERDEPQGNDFLAVVSKEWERAFNAADTPQTRKVLVRISSVLLADKGLLKPLIGLARFGLGGHIGGGDQYISWIHEADFVQLVDWIISRKDIQGVVHASSPNPVKNRNFMKILRQALRIPFGVPNYTWSTKLGGWLIGTEADLVLSGRRVVSATLAESGFVFDYPEINGAIRNLVVKNNSN